MPNMTIDVNWTNDTDLTQFYAFLEGITAYAQVDATEFTATNPGDGIDFEFNGAGLTYDVVSNKPLSGTITQIVLISPPNTPIATFDFSLAPLDAVAFIAAVDELATNQNATPLNDIFVNYGSIFTGNAGNDQYTSLGFGQDILKGGAGDDILDAGTDNFDTLEGEDGNDQLFGGAGNDNLMGGADDDFLVGGSGSDTIDGGDGLSDRASYTGSGAGVTVTLGVNGAQTVGKGGDAEGDKISNVEHVDGSNSADVLTGNSLANILNGFGGIDKINGGAGNDVIEGGAGNDNLIGGAGIDTVSYVSSGAAVTVTLGKDGAATTGQGGDAQGDKISGFENIMGSAHDDVLTGNNLANEIDGGAGNDIIKGVAGNDTLMGGDGDDTIEGGAGNDTLLGGDGDDTIEGGAGADILIGAGSIDGNDTVSYASSAAGVTIVLDGSNPTIGKGGDAQGDQISHFDNIVGSAKNDVLTGDGGDNTINGGLGNDVIEGGAGADTLEGGGGIDTLSYANSKDTDLDGDGVLVQLMEGDTPAFLQGDDAEGDIATHFTNAIGTDRADAFIGNSAANTFVGGAGNDNFLSQNGNDTLIGGDGDDNMDGGNGADTLTGGNHLTFGDTVTYVNSSSGVTVTLGKDGAQTIGKGGTAEGDKISQIENIVGSEFDDVLTGNNLDNKLYGNGGNNLMEGGGGADRFDGTVGNDTVSYKGSTAGVTITLGLISAGVGGDAQGDLLLSIENAIGSAKNDTIFGDDGDNTIDGGAGDDFIEGDAGIDVLKGGLGSDTLSYAGSDSAVTVTLDGNNPASVGGGHAANDTASGFENLLGSDFDDKLSGDGAKNTIEGGKGDDILDGGAGIDTLSYAGASAGVAVGLQLMGKQQDTGGAGLDTFFNFENLTGSAHDDILFGDDKANVIQGGDGKDIVVGGLGADTLDGGAGLQDELIYSDDDKGVTVTLGKNGAQTTVTGPAGSQGAGDKIMNFEGVRGGNANDKLVGNELDNVIKGNGGDDFIVGGAGADDLNGGPEGALGDTVSYAGSTAGVTVDLDAGTGLGGDAEGDVLTSIENLVGSAKDDVLIGNNLNNKIDGGAGNDTIDGGDGDDVLIGGAGTDTASHASATAGVTVDLSKVGVQQDTVGAGKDKLSGFENLTGSDHNDTLTGDSKANVIEGGDGDDTLDGKAGIDTVSYAHAGAAVVVDLSIVGVEQVTNGAGKDTLLGFENVTGSDFGDDLSGNAGANVMRGGGGLDFLRGSAGADTMDGGDAFDVLTYQASAAAVTVTLGINGAQTIGKGGDAQGDKISNIEALVGSAFNDVLIGTNVFHNLVGGGGDDLIVGGAGAAVMSGGGQAGDTISYAASKLGVTVDIANNVVSGGDAAGDAIATFNNIIGSAKDDVLTGNTKDNRIDGGAGNDTLLGDDGADTLIGGAGNDHLRGDKGDDVINGGAGIDTVFYSLAAAGVTVDLGVTAKQDTVGDGLDTLSGLENIVGPEFDDTLTGNAGANEIDGNLGDDVLDGKGGTDTVSYVRTDAGKGVTVSLAMQGVQQDTVGAGMDTLFSFENILGSLENDKLTGNAGVNRIDGNGGNDLIEGGAGADTLIGGLGTDTVSYANSAAGVTVTLGKDGAQTVGKGGEAEGDKISGVENIVGSAKNDVLTGNNLDNDIDGGDGNDLIVALGANNNLDGGNGIDTVSYALATFGIDVNLKNSSGGDNDTLSGFENIIGSKFGDSLAGDAAANVIGGGAGDDDISGFEGADTLDGGAGNDTLDYFGAVDGVTVTLGAPGVQTIGKGGDAEGDKVKNFEQIVGGDGDDALTGNAGNNGLFGGAGDDVLNGGLGNDVLDGGSDAVNGDTVSYAGIAANVTVTLDKQGGQQQNTGGAGIDALSNFENLTGGAGNDLLTGNSDANVIKGGAGNDTIMGNEGADTLDGETNGAAGDTVSYAGSINGGVTVNLTEQGTQVIPPVAQKGGDAAGDLLFGFENIVGSDDNDLLTGDDSANVIAGAAGDDVIAGGKGADTLDGGEDLDTVSYAGSAANVTVTLGANGAQTTTSGATGSDAAGDKIKNFENVTGSDLNDTLTGNDGPNLIKGGLGADTLTGGGSSPGNADRFTYDSAAEGGDTIVDFVAGDASDLIAVKAGGFGGGLEAFGSDQFLPADHFVSGSGPAAPDNAHGYFLFDTDLHRLVWDADGSDAGVAQLIAIFSNAAELTENDIFVMV